VRLPIPVWHGRQAVSVLRTVRSECRWLLYRNTRNRRVSEGASAAISSTQTRSSTLPLKQLEPSLSFSKAIRTPLKRDQDHSSAVSRGHQMPTQRDLERYASLQLGDTRGLDA
jgi:hypothetical protein